MFTIYYRNLCAYVQSHNLDPSTQYGYFRNGIKGLSYGDVRYFYDNASIYYISGDDRNPWHTRYKIGSRIGSGTTSPTDTDYKPETNISVNSGTGSETISNFTTTSSTVSDGEHITTTITITGTNTSSSTVTISEVVIYKICVTNTGNFVDLWVPIARELLDTPKVVASNESFTLTLVWVD